MCNLSCTKDTKTDFWVYPAVTVKAYIFRAQFGKRHRNPLHSQSVFVILVAFCFNACGIFRRLRDLGAETLDAPGAIDG